MSPLFNFSAAPSALTVALVGPPALSTIQPTDSLVVDVTSPDTLTAIVVSVSYPDTGVVEVVYDGVSFRGAYAASSSRANIANGFRFTIALAAGWSSRPGLEVFAIDASGGAPVRANWSWQLAAAAAGAAAAGTDPLAALSSAPTQADEFLGYGLLQPFRRDKNSDFLSGGGAALVRSCVEQVMGTQCSGMGVQGELEWRTRFGSLLHLLRHANNDDIARALAYQYTVDALHRWEPRVSVTDVEIVKKAVPGRSPALVLTIFYELISTNTSGNRVVVSDKASVQLV